MITHMHIQTCMAPTECCSVLRDRDEGTRCPAKSGRNHRLMHYDQQRQERKKKSMAAVKSDSFWRNQPGKETTGGVRRERGVRGREIKEKAIKAAPENRVGEKKKNRCG